MSIKNNVKKLCDEAGITINKLEQETGIGRGSVARWDEHEPSIAKVQAVADYFDMSLDELLGIKKDPSTMNREEVDEELYELMTDLRDNYALRQLLHAAKGTDAENIEAVAEMLKRFKK